MNLLQCLDLEFSADSPPSSFVIGGPAKPARFSVAEANPHRLTLSHQHHEPISQRSGRKTVTGLEPPSLGIWQAVNTPDRSSWKANPKRETDFLTVSFLLGGHQPLAVESFRKYTHKSENISVTLTKWQLNRVQLKCAVVHEGIQKPKNRSRS